MSSRRSVALALVLFGSAFASIAFSANVGATCSTPCVTLLYPNGGEVLTGGVPQNVTWFLAADSVNPNTTVNVTFSSDWSDENWTVLQYYPENGSINPGYNRGWFWMPQVDAPSAFVGIYVSGYEPPQGSDGVDAPVTVDSTPPSVSVTVLNDIPGERACATSGLGESRGFVPPVLDVRLDFSEPVNRTSVEDGLRVSVRLVNETTMGESYSMIPNQDLLISWDGNHTQARVYYDSLPQSLAKVSVRLGSFLDKSSPGNSPPPMGEDPTIRSFCTQPSNEVPQVTLLSSLGGRTFSGNTAQTVVVEVSDDWRYPELSWPTYTPPLYEPLLVSVNFTPAEPGLGTIFQGYLPNGVHAVNWTVPGVDYPWYRITLEAWDNGSLVTGNPLRGTATSPPFAVDATPPAVLSMSPPPSATAVALDEPLELVFTEPVDPASAESALWMNGYVGPLAFTWLDPRTLRVDHDPFPPLHEYAWGLRCEFRDLSVPGNLGVPCPSATFSTANTPPSVTVDPLVGAPWSGGSFHPISWGMTDATTGGSSLTATASYRVDGGLWILAASGVGLTSALIPAACPGISLEPRVAVTDPQGMAGSSVGPAVALDCARPTVVSHAPADNATGVSPLDPIRIEFSEPMDPATIGSCAWLAPSPGAVTASLSDDGRTLTLDHPPFTAGGTYTVVLCADASDRSDPGLLLGGYVFSFTTAEVPDLPPTISLDMEAPTRPSPGAVARLSWVAADAEGASLFTVVREAVSGSLIDSAYRPRGVQTLDWVLPLLDGTVLVEVCVRDSRGQEACDALGLEVDGRRPAVSFDLLDGASDVDPAREILVTFDEPMRRLPWESFVRFTPEVGGLEGAWTDEQTLRLSHDGLALGTAYTLQLTCALSDAATPGNLVQGCPVPLRFSTMAADESPWVALEAPEPDSAWRTGEPMTVLWNAGDDRDSELIYEITWVQGSDGGVLDQGQGLGGEVVWILPPTEGLLVVRACVADSAGQVACAEVLVNVVLSGPGGGGGGTGGGGTPTSNDTTSLNATGLAANVTEVDDRLALLLPGTVAAADIGAVQFDPPAAGVGYEWTYENGGTRLEVLHEPLEACRDYRVSLTDALGLPVWQDAFRTRCGPVVAVEVATEAEVLRGGTTVLLTWNVTDEDSADAAIFLNYSLVGGFDGFPAQVSSGTVPLGAGALYWTVPAEDTSALAVRLWAEDAEAHAAWSTTRTLRVDATPPVPFIAREGALSAGEPVDFDGSHSYDAFSGIARYRWRVWTPGGDLLLNGYGATASYRFEEPGEYRVTLDVWDGAGNWAQLTHRLPVGAPGGAGGDVVTEEVVIGGSLLGVAALAAGATASSEPVRNWGWRNFILPLWVRLKPEQVTNQETRGMIRGYILVHPGDCFTDIRRNLRLTAGTLTYHLDVLERERIVKSRSQGSKKLFYPADMPVPEDGGGLHELQIRILKVIDEQPGIAVPDLAGVLGVSKQLVHYHARELQARGQITAERVGITRRFFRAPSGMERPRPARRPAFPTSPDGEDDGRPAA